MLRRMSGDGATAHDGAGLQGKLAGSSSKFLVLTLNEGKLRLPPGRLSAAVAEAVRGLPEGAVREAAAVLVARQEASRWDMVTVPVPCSCGSPSAVGEQWDAAMTGLGFASKVIEVGGFGQTRVALYAKDGSEFEPCWQYSTTFNCSVALAVVRHRGSRLLLGSVHLDSHTKDLREDPVLAAIAEARAAVGLDAALVAGDFNYTMEPTARAMAFGGKAALVSERLQSELTKALAQQASKFVTALPEDLQGFLLENLATPAGRVALATLDGMPEVLALPFGPAASSGGGGCGGELGALRLTGLGVGTFPTYRLCNKDNLAFTRFAADEAAFGRDEKEFNCCEGPPETAEEPLDSSEERLLAQDKEAKATRPKGVLTLRSTACISADAVKACYFVDNNKGHSGAIKKRGSCCRLGIGWMDRLYVGDGPGSLAGNDSTERHSQAVQSDPIFILGENDEPLDHALMTWCVDVPLAGASSPFKG